MRIEDLSVEVRDKELVRVGTILAEDLDLEVHIDYNNTGSWTLRLPVEHHLASILQTPGSGIVVSGPEGVLFSGPSIEPELAESADDPEGMVTVVGVGDAIVLADRLAFPDPTNADPTTQRYAHDTRTGAVETIMHNYVVANAGFSAPVSRRVANLFATGGEGRGPTITKSARFQVLGTLLSDLAYSASLGFRVLYSDDDGGLVFDTFAVSDKSAEIRLSVDNETLSSSKVGLKAPTATHVIVGGQGDLTQRKFYLGTSPESLQAATDWGRRIERFVDQRQTDNVDEYAQRANEVLAQEGFTQVSVKVVPIDDEIMKFGAEWGIGDTIAVIAGGAEVKSLVTGCIIRADKDGVRLAVKLGDFASKSELEQRLDYLERADGPSFPGSGGGSLGFGPKIQTGVVDVACTADTPSTVTIEFGDEFFGSPPVLQGTPVTVTPEVVKGIGFNKISPTEAEVWVTSAETRSVRVMWTAIGDAWKPGDFGGEYKPPDIDWGGWTPTDPGDFPEWPGPGEIPEFEWTPPGGDFPGWEGGFDGDPNWGSEGYIPPDYTNPDWRDGLTPEFGGVGVDPYGGSFGDFLLDGFGMPPNLTDLVEIEWIPKKFGRMEGFSNSPTFLAWNEYSDIPLLDFDPGEAGKPHYYLNGKNTFYRAETEEDANEITGFNGPWGYWAVQMKGSPYSWPGAWDQYNLGKQWIPVDRGATLTLTDSMFEGRCVMIQIMSRDSLASPYLLQAGIEPDDGLESIEFSYGRTIFGRIWTPNFEEFFERGFRTYPYGDERESIRAAGDGGVTLAGYYDAMDAATFGVNSHSHTITIPDGTDETRFFYMRIYDFGTQNNLVDMNNPYFPGSGPGGLYGEYEGVFPTVQHYEMEPPTITDVESYLDTVGWRLPQHKLWDANGPINFQTQAWVTG